MVFPSRRGVVVHGGGVGGHGVIPELKEDVGTLVLPVPPSYSGLQSRVPDRKDRTGALRPTASVLYSKPQSDTGEDPRP